MFGTLLRRIMRTGVRRGMAGSRAWFVVGVAAGGVRLLLHLARDEDEVVYRTVVQPGDRVLVAVSGGKDSLGLWHLLRGLGYDADGLYVGLGIGEYSDESRAYADAFAHKEGWKLLHVDIPETFGFDIPDGSRAAKR